MKKDLLLVLCFYEGQGFCPKDEHSVVVSARIDGNILSSDPVPQTSEPKFCTEVSWQVDHQTLRRYKLSRVPVRVECHSVNKNNENRYLGYIILTLSSVVQGIETDPKWHKLLGGSLVQSKVPPQLLLSLNLHSVNPNGKVKSESPKMLHNGNMHGGQFTMSPVGNAIGNHVTQQNGTSHTLQDANMDSHMPLSHQDSFQISDFGALSKLGALLSDRSQVHISSSQKDLFHTSSADVENRGRVESGSPKCFEEEEGNLSQSQQADFEDDELDAMCKIETVYTENAEDKLPLSHKGVVQCENIKENYFTNCNGRVESKSKFIPPSPVEKVKRLFDCEFGGKSPDKDKTSVKQRSLESNDNYSVVEDEGLDSGFHSKFGGNAGGWPTTHTLPHSSGEIGLSVLGQNNGSQYMNQNNYEDRRHSDPLIAFGLGDKQNYIPVKNVRGFQSGVNSSAGRPSGGHSDYLVPQLNHEGGFFQIGPVGDAEEESFEFSVSIVFAKNLEQLLPRDFVWSANSETCFSYSLMGCVITSDPIKNLHNPDFLAERAAGNVRATASNLSAYFKKNPDLPIHLLIGDLCLASTSINLAKFQDIDSNLITRMPLTVEGWYQMVSVVSESTDVVPGKEPLLGAIVQISGVSQRSSHHHHHIPSAMSTTSDASESEVELHHDEFPFHTRRNYRTEKVKHHRSKKLDLASLSSSSSTSEDEIFPAGKRHKSTNPLKLHPKETSYLGDLHSLRALSDEGNRLRRHMFKAALEVESWKEDQQVLFLKQWSAKESELQRHLSDEWKSRINTIETNLQRRNAAVNRKLSTAISELTIREKKLSSREERVRKLLEELELQKREQEEAEKGTFEGRLNQREKKENNDLLEELTKEKKRREQLECEVDELKATLAQVEMSPQNQQQEMKKQVFALKREKESLSEQLSTALKKKQYYKVQWVRSVGELHHLRTSRLHDVDTLRSEMEMSSPEPYYIHPRHYRKHRQRSHTVDGGSRPIKRRSTSRKHEGKNSQSLFLVKPLEQQRLKGNFNMEPGCSWMDRQTSRETRNRVEPRVSGLSRSRTESGRTMEMGKGRRTSIGNGNEYEELTREKNNEEPLEKLLKEKNVWRMGEK